MKMQRNTWAIGIIICLLVTGAFGQTSYLKNTHMSSLTESRGLSAFHGNIPTLSSSLRVGSTSGVSRFIRQSVGLSTLSSAQDLYDPKNTYYIDPLAATLRTDQILQAEGRGEVPLPGRSNPPSSSMNEMYVNAMPDYASIMPHTNRLVTSENVLSTRKIKKIPPMRTYAMKNYGYPRSDLAKKVEKIETKTLDMLKVTQLHRDLHASDECHYAKADTLWVMELVHGLLKEHFDIELCWANCVHYAHTDSQMEVQDIGLCKECGYCKPNSLP